MTMRVATYSRYSSDLQRDSSIDDQKHLCRSYCERQGWEIVQEYSDHALSGTTMLGRSGLVALLEAAQERRFDAIVTEAIDRISRDQSDLFYIAKRLEFVGIQIVTPHHGFVDDIGLSVHGIVSSMFVANLRQKVKRAHGGVLRQGRLPGPPVFGYERGDNPGEWRIKGEEAGIVRQIYERFAEGHSAQKIADDLTAAGIPSPKGRVWNRSTISDRINARPGILGNPIYRGRPRWNLTKKVRAPDGRRVSRPADPSEHVELHLPHLQIIDDVLFEAVTAMRERRTAQWMPNGRTRRQPVPRTFDSPLTGLFRCSHCGGHMVIGAAEQGRKRVVCSNARRSVLACPSLHYYRIDKLEDATFDVLFSFFDDPDVTMTYIRGYVQKRRELAEEAKRGEAQTRKRLTDVKASIMRFIAALDRGSMPEDFIHEKLQQLEAERVDLERRLADAESAQAEYPLARLHSEAWVRAGQSLTNLRAALADPVQAAQARADFRAIVESITVYPTPPRQNYRVLVNTRVGVLLGLEPLPAVRSPAEMAADAGVTSASCVHAASAAP